MQAYSIEQKIQISQTRIIEWHDRFDGKVYISFSGGKDSTVLLWLARRIYPDIKAVYFDTGLEYPEVRNFVKKIPNVDWVKPNMNFKQVIQNFGYPIISKEVARDVAVAKRNPNSKTAQKFIRGSDYHKKYGDAWLLERYKYLIDAPFNVSNYCCTVMKKQPAYRYNKETGMYPIVGTMASESRRRKSDWLMNGCNAFENKHPQSKPLSIWNENDILTVLERFHDDILKVLELEDCEHPWVSLYGEIESKNGKKYFSGLDRTGCMFCGFGCTSEKCPNRFQRLKQTHPQIWEWIMKPTSEGGLGMKEVLEYIGVKIE